MNRPTVHGRTGEAGVNRPTVHGRTGEAGGQHAHAHAQCTVARVRQVGSRWAAPGQIGGSPIRQVRQVGSPRAAWRQDVRQRRESGEGLPLGIRRAVGPSREEPRRGERRQAHLALHSRREAREQPFLRLCILEVE